jgi:hypothetical protein
MIQELIERVRLYEQDHAPDGWPAIKMRDVSALADAIEAQQAELDHAMQDSQHWCDKYTALRAERDALAAKLVPLTDEQIADLHRYAYTTGKAFTTIEVYTYFARAIEAAHGIQAKGGQHEDA